MSFNHTAETDARIRQGYEAGERVLDIANALGTTRNVIIGRAGRIGLARTGENFGPTGHTFVTPEGLASRGAIAKVRVKQLWQDPDYRSRVLSSRSRYWAERRAAQ